MTRAERKNVSFKKRSEMKGVFGFSLAIFAVATSLSARPVKWEFPRLQPHEGIPFADAKTGILVWHGEGYLDVTAGRADWWEHRGGSPWLAAQSYTNIVALIERGERDALRALFRRPGVEGEPRAPFLLPFGRVRFDLGGAKVTDGELDPRTGLGKIRFVKDGRSLEAELAMSFKTGVFAIRWPDGFVPMGKAIAAWDSVIGGETTPRVRARLKKIGYTPPVYRGDGMSGGFTQRLPNGDPPGSLDFVTRGGETLLATSRGESAPIAAKTFAEVREDAVSFWKSWWSSAPTVDVPDEEIAEMYEFGMYKFGAMTDESGVPAGLQGPWIEDHNFPPWNGDYHFNINVQECYWPAYHGNKLANLKPLFRMIRSWWPILRNNAKAFVGIDDGFVLPHALDDRGTCIGGLWTGTIDHGSTAWMAAYMFRYVRYANDLAFLKSDAYPFMKGAFNVYYRMMAEDGGNLCIPYGPSPEYGWKLKEEVNKNSSFQLAAAHRLTRDLIKAAELLGESPDPRWLDVEKRLPQFGVAVDQECGKGEQIGLYDGMTIRMSHRHHSHLAGLVPFDTIDLKTHFRQVQAAMWWLGWTGPGLWAGWSYPWASMIYTHVGEPTAAYWALKSWKLNFVNPGHGSRHNHYYHGLSIMGRMPMTRNGDFTGNEIMQMDAQMAATAAVQDMMVHERGGVVRLFAGCPDFWKRVSFENMLVEGGFLVSATRENGKVVRLEVKRPVGSNEKLRLELPGTREIVER